MPPLEAAIPSLLQHGVEGIAQVCGPGICIRVDAEQVTHLEHGALLLQHEGERLMINDWRGRGCGRI